MELITAQNLLIISSYFVVTKPNWVFPSYFELLLNNQPIRSPTLLTATKIFLDQFHPSDPISANNVP